MSIGTDWGRVDGDVFNADAARIGGVTFAFRKLYQAPYGADGGFADDWQALKKAGIKRFAYIFPDCRPNAAPARVQVTNAHVAFVAAGGWSDGDGAICVDVEFPGGHLPQSIPAIVAFLEDFVTAVHDIFGCWAIIYSSARVWDGSDTDALHGPQSWIPTKCPLWDKTGYVRAARQPLPGEVPIGRPRMPFAWQAANSPGCWLNQWDGDVIGVAGYSTTVDVNRFLNLNRGNAKTDDAGRIAWVQTKLVILGAPLQGPLNVTGVWDTDTDHAVEAYQLLKGLKPDRDIGPATFAYLSRE